MVPGNNELEPTKIIRLSSFKMQGNHHLYCLYVSAIIIRKNHTKDTDAMENTLN